MIVLMIGQKQVINIKGLSVSGGLVKLINPKTNFLLHCWAIIFGTVVVLTPKKSIFSQKILGF